MTYPPRLNDRLLWLNIYKRLTNIILFLHSATSVSSGLARRGRRLCIYSRLFELLLLNNNNNSHHKNNVLLVAGLEHPGFHNL